MFQNMYFEELANDINFLEKLKANQESYRVFGPFLQNKYADLFVPDPDRFTAGIYDYDILRLCRKAGIFAPVYIPCVRMSRKGEDDYRNVSITDRIKYDFNSDVPGRKYCIGIGHYETRDEGDFHMCVLIDLFDGIISGISFSTEFSPSMTEKAIAITYDLARPYDITVHSSQNKVYRTEIYREICDLYQVAMSMTTPCTHGGIMPVSLFFSALMRKKADYQFTDIQDGIDWLTCYILKHNVGKNLVHTLT